MDADMSSYGYTLGRANMVGYFASFVAVLPLEQLVADLDEFERLTPFGAAEVDRTARYRIRDREAAAILLVAKQQLIALYAAYGVTPCMEPKIRDSRPPLPVPFDPVNGAEVDAPLSVAQTRRIFEAAKHGALLGGKDASGA